MQLRLADVTHRNMTRWISQLLQHLLPTGKASGSCCPPHIPEIPGNLLHELTDGWITATTLSSRGIKHHIGFFKSGRLRDLEEHSTITEELILLHFSWRQIVYICIFCCKQEKNSDQLRKQSARRNCWHGLSMDLILASTDSGTWKSASHSSN